MSDVFMPKKLVTKDNGRNITVMIVNLMNTSESGVEQMVLSTYSQNGLAMILGFDVDEGVRLR
jgi:hypothetical protein